MKKEYKKYFDKHILTKSILLSGLVTCEEQINKYAYMEKKWRIVMNQMILYITNPIKRVD